MRWIVMTIMAITIGIGFYCLFKIGIADKGFFLFDKNNNLRCTFKGGWYWYSKISVGDAIIFFPFLKFPNKENLFVLEILKEINDDWEGKISVYLLVFFSGEAFECFLKQGARKDFEEIERAIQVLVEKTLVDLSMDIIPGDVDAEYKRKHLQNRINNLVRGVIVERLSVSRLN